MTERGVSRSKTAAVLFLSEVSDGAPKHLGELCNTIAEDAHDKKCWPKEWAQKLLHFHELTLFGRSQAKIYFMGQGERDRRAVANAETVARVERDTKSAAQLREKLRLLKAKEKQQQARDRKSIARFVSDWDGSRVPSVLPTRKRRRK